MTLPTWWRRPGETATAFRERTTAEYLAEQAAWDAGRALPSDDGSLPPVGIGTYDLNGEPKGMGWA